MKIIYQNDDGGISVVHPTSEALETLTIEEIAILDVPQGIAFYVVEDSELPFHIAQEAWELDTDREPCGYGCQNDQD